VKLPICVLFWTVLAPVIFLTVLSLLVYPLGYSANAIWPDIKPFAVKVALWSYGVVGLLVSGFAVGWVWRRFRGAHSQAVNSTHV